MNDVERYEWAEKLMTFRNADGTVDQERLKEFAESGELKATPDDLAAILNITQDLINNEQDSEITEDGGKEEESDSPKEGIPF